MADNIPRFGASDFWLVQTDAAQLREQLRSALETVLGRPVVDADPHMVLASAFLPFFVQGQASADACAKATLRAFAVGQDLDRIADSTCVVGYLNRMPARGAVFAYQIHCTIQRSIATVASVCRVAWSASCAEPYAQDGSGATVQFSGAGTLDIEFLATDGASKEVWLPIYLVCEVPGKQFNGLFMDTAGTGPGGPFMPTLSGSEVGGAEGQTYTFADIDPLRRCGASYGGRDVESDEEFAQRVAWQAKALRVPGSVEYFRLALSELHLLPSWMVLPVVDSEGRVQFAWADKASYFEPAGSELTVRGQAYDGFMAIVKSSLMVEQRGYVYEATVDSQFVPDTGYRYWIDYYLPADTIDVDSAKAAVEAAWSQYVSDHAWHCGAVLRVSEMIAVLIGAGASRAFSSPSEPRVTPYDTTLPADRFVTLDALNAQYRGLSSDTAAPTGGTGEEVVP